MPATHCTLPTSRVRLTFLLWPREVSWVVGKPHRYAAAGMATEAGALLSDFDLPFPPGARVLFTSGPHRGLEATALRTRPATERKPECLLVRLDGSQAATLCLDVGNDSGAVRDSPSHLPS